MSSNKANVYSISSSSYKFSSTVTIQFDKKSIVFILIISLFLFFRAKVLKKLR